MAAAAATSPPTWAATPSRPRLLSAAHTGTPRARRDSSGTFSNGPPGPSASGAGAPCVVHQVAGMQTHGSPQRGRVPDDGDAAVIGHVQCFVGICAPRVGLLIALGEVPQFRCGSGPQPEGAVNVHPRAMFVGDGDRLGKG